MTEMLSGKLTELIEGYAEEGESFSFTTYYVGRFSVNEFLEKYTGKEIRITVEEMEIK